MREPVGATKIINIKLSNSEKLLAEVIIKENENSFPLMEYLPQKIKKAQNWGSDHYVEIHGGTNTSFSEKTLWSFEISVQNIIEQFLNTILIQILNDIKIPFSSLKYSKELLLITESKLDIFIDNQLLSPAQKQLAIKNFMKAGTSLNLSILLKNERLEEPRIDLGGFPVEGCGNNDDICSYALRTKKRKEKQKTPGKNFNYLENKKKGANRVSFMVESEIL